MRKGNPHARRLLCEFAHAASRTQSVFKSKFQALTVRCGYKRAIIAIGHKILRTIYVMLKRGEHYRDSTTDYEALSIQKKCTPVDQGADQIRLYPARQRLILLR